jgi:hypothetical protein
MLWRAGPRRDRSSPGPVIREGDPRRAAAWRPALDPPPTRSPARGVAAAASLAAAAAHDRWPPPSRAAQPPAVSRQGRSSSRRSLGGAPKQAVRRRLIPSPSDPLLLDEQASPGDCRSVRWPRPRSRNRRAPFVRGSERRTVASPRESGSGGADACEHTHYDCLASRRSRSSVVNRQAGARPFRVH